MLALMNIRKAFGSNLVLQNVDFELRSGEVHVLFGENGAGKSTLMNIATGMLSPDGGSIQIGEESFAGLTPSQARKLGIATVFQEFTLVPSMTVAENLFLGRELKAMTVLSRRGMAQQTRQALARLNFNLDPNARIKDLSRAEQQMVEIAKALLTEASIMIFDEPTASLTDSEADSVLATIRRLADGGMGIIYISHRMREIREIANRVTVLRSGVNVGTVEGDEINENKLVEMMTGRKIDAYFPTINHSPGRITVEVKNLTTAGIVNGVSLRLQAGEVVGLAGLVGCGKGEIGRSIYGLEKIVGGQVLLEGVDVTALGPREMLGKKLCYFPADRNVEGLCLNRSVEENVALASTDIDAFRKFGGRIEAEAERQSAENAMRRLKLHPMNMNDAVQNYSGGNRQKVMLGRALMRDLDVFIFDEPTVGIDVGAKVEVYNFIRELTERGASVLVISSELIEVTALCNRIYVVHHGRIVRELEGSDCNQENILNAFFDDVRTKVEERA
ncbi:sugar ABC transporter ATP-binding protein [Pseudaminobacter salicylatoxidans]|uniref:sugar ABC transporter ATP-binding protein n=1 Tax=Pseudaminobacter salicylatoxidans TaxID=93369 RepID=UPI00030025AD|nr:sugar ABC transporter ATP-binding protein [Pseudaminobacter salicylatoxidans]